MKTNKLTAFTAYALPSILKTIAEQMKSTEELAQSADKRGLNGVAANYRAERIALRLLALRFKRNARYGYEA